MPSNEFPVNDIERALSAARRMIDARAALQIIKKGNYRKCVDGWIFAIREEMRLKNLSVMEVVCRMSEQERDQWMLLEILAAGLEVIEEQTQGRLQ